jgi:tryptophan halogenase
MKIGKHKNIAVKNVYAVGLSAGFVEPLEATGITFTTKAVQNLTRIILQQNGMYDNNSREYLSREFETMIDEIHNFIFIHYNLCHRKDTEFWKDVHKIKLPPSVEKLYRMFSPSPPPALHMKGHFDMFHVGQWFELLFLMGFYDNSNLEITDAVKKYGDLSYNLYKTKTQAQIEAFPNHALYLRDWYND